MLILSIFLLSYSYISSNIKFFMYDEDKSKTLEVEKLKTALSKLVYCRFEVISDLNSLQVICDSNYPHLPEHLYLLKKINLFYCTNSGLSELPRNFSELKEISHLDLRGNKFKTIPEEIFELSKITHLDFSKNRLENISNKILNLENLKLLNLGYNMIKTISNMTFLQNPTHLDISNNSFCKRSNKCENVIKNLVQMENLEKLLIEGNDIDELPIDVFMSNLKILNASNNSLVELPPSLSNCKDLEELYLNNNCFDTFPKVILSLRGLILLNVECSQLNETLKLNEDNCPNLESLNLRFDNISLVKPFSFRLKNLKRLFLATKKIENLDFSELDLPDCTDLNLIGDIKKIDGNFSKCSSLKNLNIEISDPYVLKDTLYGLKNLRILSIQVNNYKGEDVTISIFKGLEEAKNLEKFEMADASLTIFPSEILNCTNLTMLDLSNNKIKTIPDEIHKLQNLLILKIENNNLSEINKNIFKIKTLKKGIFQGNNIEYLPKEFTPDYYDVILFNKYNLRPLANSDYLGFFDLPDEYLRDVDHLYLYCVNNTFNITRLYRFIEKGNIQWNLNEVLAIKPEELKKHKKDFDYLSEIWKKYLLPNIEEDDLKEVWEYVKSIYNTPDSDLIVKDINFEAGKEFIKDYIENVFDILKQRIIDGDKDIVSILFMLIRDGIYKCFDGQLEAWRVAFTSLNNDYNEDLTIEKFIKDTLAKIKENILKKITTSNSNPQNIHIFSHWKYVLQNELGFSNSPKLYANSPHLKIYELKGYILYKFFREFRPKNVIEEILEIINKNKTMLSAIAKKIFKDNESNLSVIESFFEYENDIEYQLIHKITFDGLLYILKALNLIILISENTDI